MDANKFVSMDQLRYKKNKFSANFALLSIVFNAFYFISIYKSDVGNFYYRMLIGVSVLFNLVFMLAAFLSSEGVKNYKKVYAYILIGLGVIQVARIFYLPLQAFTSTVGKNVQVMDTFQFISVAIMLLISAACAIIAGIFGLKKTRQLKEHNEFIKKVEEGLEEMPDLSEFDVDEKTQESTQNIVAE